MFMRVGIRSSYRIPMRLSIRHSHDMTSMIEEIVSAISKETPKQEPRRKQDNISKFGNKYDKFNSNQVNNNGNRYKKYKKKDELSFQNGSTRLQQLFLMTFKEIKKINPRGRIMEISPQGLQRTNIMNVLDTINLDNEGIDLVRVDNIKGEDVPLIKRIDLKKAGQLYSDYLHQQVTLDSGLISKRSKPEHKKETKIKMYKLSWTLSLNDLINVKLKEIWNQVLKNNRVEIYLASKRDLRFVGDNFLKIDQDSVKLDEVERIKREKLIDNIENFVHQRQDQYKVNMTIEGSVNNRMFIVLKMEKSK